MLVIIWTCFQLFWSSVVLITQLGYVWTGSTTNEQFNSWKYDWMHQDSENKKPFDLGPFRNCLAFWLPSRGAWRNINWANVYEIPIPWDVENDARKYMELV